MKNYTNEEVKYLKLSGLYENECFDDSDMRDFLDSLSEKEKIEYDLYDEDADCCSLCISKFLKTYKINDIKMTINGKKCRYCGAIS